MRTVRIIFAIAALAVAVGLTGCVQKVKVSMLQPGKLKLSGVSKIALMDFNSVNARPHLGTFAADEPTCILAKRSVADAFYEEPYYQIVDISLEQQAKKIGRTHLTQRMDALLYGRVWWQISPEYSNFKPEKATLETWVMRRYACGESDGKTIYCTTRLTTRQEDKLYKKHYRVATASLMMALSVYRIDPRSGELEKLTHVFEVAKRPVKIVNGEFGQELEFLGRDEEVDRTKVLKAAAEASGFMSKMQNLFGSADVVQNKVELDAQSEEDLVTIPVALDHKNVILEEMTDHLSALIAPSREDFDVPVAGKDKKTLTLLSAKASVAAVKYLSREKLAKGDAAIGYGQFFNVEFLEGAKKLMENENKAKWDAMVADYGAERAGPYEPLTDEDATAKAMSYLKTNSDEVYNLALAVESFGDHERALYMYRFGFYNLDEGNQNFADGIGRCLLALDQNDRIVEKDASMDNAKDRNKL